RLPHLHRLRGRRVGHVAGVGRDRDGHVGGASGRWKRGRGGGGGGGGRCGRAAAAARCEQEDQSDDPWIETMTHFDISPLAPGGMKAARRPSPQGGCHTPTAGSRSTAVRYGSDTRRALTDSVCPYRGGKGVAGEPRSLPHAVLREVVAQRALRDPEQRGRVLL